MNEIAEISGVPVAVPTDPRELNKKIKRSKFAKLIRAMEDDDVKALVFCIVFSPATKEAIDCWTQAVQHEAQLAALKQEFHLRGLEIKPELQIENVGE